MGWGSPPLTMAAPLAPHPSPPPKGAREQAVASPGAAYSLSRRAGEGRGEGTATSWHSLLPDALAPTWLLREPLPLEVAEGGQPCHHGPLRLLAGPRRVETGWWPDPAAPGAPVAARDYYIAQNPAAELLWVYRERATSAAPSAAGPRWFLHGLYA